MRGGARVCRRRWDRGEAKGQSHGLGQEEGTMATLSVPDHREVAKGTLRSLIRASGMTTEVFVALVDRQVPGA